LRIQCGLVVSKEDDAGLDVAVIEAPLEFSTRFRFDIKLLQNYFLFTFRIFAFAIFASFFFAFLWF